jgi:sterol desaturase/sphingolipid hydroxylase (fatty acid hydroxylase superfamily)
VPRAALARLIVGFWAAWFTLVFLTNLCDALKALGLVGEEWKFASGNWAFVVKTTGIYRVPAPLVGVLFAGVVAWEALSALLMWSAVRSLGGPPEGSRMGAVDRAFTVALGLFAAFALADELFIAYHVEGTHLQVFLALLASLLAVRLLPDAGTAPRGRG